MAAETFGLALAVAGLFSSCIEAFHYFKAGQRFEEDYDILLVKLDIEKTRLLAWGNSVAILDENQRNKRLDDHEKLEVVQRCLRSIERLLTDSEKLRSYGVRNSDMPRNRSIEYLSSNSMNLFKVAYARFRIRHTSNSFRPTLASRAKWAIYEQPKFGQLINDLKDLIDGLYQIMDIGRNTQDDIILADIGLIEDLSQLRLLDAASEGSYRAYSEATKSVIAASEMGTVDQRNPDEATSDVENSNYGGLNNHFNTDRLSSEGDIESLFAHLIDCKKFIVLTGQCQRSRSSEPCGTAELGTESFGNTRGHYHFNVASDYARSDNALWQLVLKFLDIKSKLESLIEKSALVGNLLQKEEELLSIAQQQFLYGMLPVATAYIHCPPCVALIQTALVIAKGVAGSSRPFLRILIRPDDRLASSCCQNSDGTEALRSILDAIHHNEGDIESVAYTDDTDYLDRSWIEQRLNFMEEERKYDVVEDWGSSAIILGEAKYLLPLLQKAPRSRIPRESEIWTMSRQRNGITTREFLGSFTPRRLSTATNTTTASFTQTSAASQSLSRRRASFSPPAAKRARTSTTLTDDRLCTNKPYPRISANRSAPRVPSSYLSNPRVLF